MLNAGRLMAETGVGAVKLEWCPRAPEVVEFLVQNGLPVMGHVGFTPQQVHQLGGYHLQGKDKSSVARLLQQARAFEKAGAFSVVLELVPQEVSRRLTHALRIPTIGIGAGPHCDGQVQVLHDLLGLLPDFSSETRQGIPEPPRVHFERYPTLSREVKAGRFAPGA